MKILRKCMSHWIKKYVYHVCVFRFDWVTPRESRRPQSKTMGITMLQQPPLPFRNLLTKCWNLAGGICSQVGDWCWGIRSGSESAFQFILKVFDGVEVSALCRAVNFSTLNWEKHLFMGYVHGGVVWFKQEKVFHKLLQQSGNQTMWLKYHFVL